MKMGVSMKVMWADVTRVRFTKENPGLEDLDLEVRQQQSLTEQ